MVEQSAPPSYNEAIGEKNDFASSLNPQQFPPASQVYQSTANQYAPELQPVSTTFHSQSSEPSYAHAQVPQQQYYTSGYPPQSGIVNPNFTGEDTSANSTETRQPTYHLSPETTADTVRFTMSGGFDDKNVRRLFVRKVFIILALQLLVTFGIICIFYFIDDVKYFIQRNPAVYYAAYGVFLVTYFVLVCSTSAARSHPCNLIMLALLTLGLSYMAATICSFYDVEAVVAGFGITVVVCTTVILFSLQTKFDFTKCGGLLFILVMVLFVFGFVTIFTYWTAWYLQVVYGALGALVFTLFLAFDTQLVMGGRKYELDPEEYIFASLILYIDIIYIFLFILTIFGGGSSR